jgi:hypothetical protein
MEEKNIFHENPVEVRSFDGNFLIPNFKGILLTRYSTSCFLSKAISRLLYKLCFLIFFFFESVRDTVVLKFLSDY